MDKKQQKTCGDFGGTTASGSPCQHKVENGLCFAHRKGGNAGGRPTDYDPEYAETAYRHCLLGATDEDLAEVFDVETRTISNWKVSHPEFFQALKRGKREADAEVAESLYHKATGMEYVEEQAIKVKTVEYENGKRKSEKQHIEVVAVKKFLPPDTTAIIFWLKNRDREHWRDRKDYMVDIEADIRQWAEKHNIDPERAVEEATRIIYGED